MVGMPVEEARAAIGSLGVDADGPLEAIGDGWAYHTFLLDGQWIFRFPRRADVHAALNKEAHILPRLAPRVPFQVPRFEHRGEHNGWWFVGYRRIAGRALAAADLCGPAAASVARALRALHAVPPAELFGDTDGREEWRRTFEQLRDEAAVDLRGRCGADVLAAVSRGFDRFLGEDLPRLPRACVVHCDLGREHLVMTAAGDQLVGIIDFEDAATGDPAIDFVGLLILTDLRTVQRVLNSYRPERDLDLRFVARMQFYYWMGSYHAVRYGLSRSDHQLVREAVAEMTRRLRSTGLLPGGSR